MRKLIQASLAVLLSLSLASPMLAVGGANFSNEVISARSAGQGYVSVAAQNDDPMTVYSNPGGIPKLKGTQLTYGFHWENIHGNYETDTGVKSKMKSDDLYVPNLAVTQNLMDGKLGLGLSVTSPYGIDTHWPGNGPLRYVATDTRLGMVIISPAVAYQVLPMVSVGVGADYVNLFNAQMDKHINANPLGAPSASDAVASLRGNGVGWGYHAGLVIEPNSQHAVGLSFHNMVKIRINGSESLSGLDGISSVAFGGSNYSTSANTDISLPSNLQLGYAYKPIDKWHLEADASWFHWSGGSDLRVRFAESDTTRLAVLGAGNPIPFTLRDAWSVAAGVNYKASDKWQYRGGVWYEPWAMPESTFQPAFLDLSRYGLSAGAGWAILPSLTLDVAYTAIFFHNRTIHNDVGVATVGSAQANGLYKDFTNLVAISLTHRFGAK
jgi:long-chain fatty acid transport protein